MFHVIYRLEKQDRFSCMTLITMLLFAVLLLISVKAPTTLGLVCLACDQVESIRDCSDIQTCGPNEICYLDGHYTVQGHLTYQGGCRDRRRCPTVLGGKRDSNLFCSQCCDQPWCQATLCGGKGYPADRGLMCYDCPQGLDHAEDCDRIIEASSDQACVESLVATNHGTIKYVTSLIGKAACSRLMATIHVDEIVGKRQSTGSNGLCYNCCNSDLCNNQCVSKNQTAQVCQDTGTLETCSLAQGYVCGDKTMAFNAGCLLTCGFC
ncbi:uncharacterized protein LOC127867707 isoform X1 [Dreissena polymorpha]|uniref:uncharacterized protein LOC127867707 isoform X1 n=1 Tax=Dreissena polymorpha TaxID=45954 RepID=UPI0022644FFF|nr:uncharacterized protein LOC127867707 isoform X1 [Dreissena polymorpha]